jgi:hypothetical protein
MTLIKRYIRPQFIQPGDKCLPAFSLWAEADRDVGELAIHAAKAEICSNNFRPVLKR